MPRSSRMAEACEIPAAAAIGPSPRKLPWRSNARSPKRARRARARRSASLSASTPSRRTRVPPLSNSRSECPPIPTVPSTTQPPSRGRKRNATSSASTGRCARAARSASSHTLFREPCPHLVERRAASAVALEVRPALRIPDLEHLLHSENHHVLHEPGARAIVRRHLDAALRIELHVLAVREVLVAKHPRVRIELRQRIYSGLEFFPPLQRVHVEALAVGHDHELVAPAVREHVAEARRDAEATLRVNRVTVVTPKHRTPPGACRPLRPPCTTSWDFIPLGGYPRSRIETVSRKNSGNYKRKTISMCNRLWDAGWDLRLVGRKREKWAFRRSAERAAAPGFWGSAWRSVGAERLGQRPSIWGIPVSGGVTTSIWGSGSRRGESKPPPGARRAGGSVRLVRARWGEELRRLGSAPRGPAGPDPGPAGARGPSSAAISERRARPHRRARAFQPQLDLDADGRDGGRIGGGEPVGIEVREG